MTTAAVRFMSERVLTASPLQRLVMLYDRALLDLDRAHLEAGAGRPAEASTHVMHALAVVSELHGSLDVSVWDGGPGLADLYTWILGELLAARAGSDLDALVPVRSVLDSLRSSWAELAMASHAAVLQARAG